MLDTSHNSGNNKHKLLTDDFDPWYVLLSEPSFPKEKPHNFLVQPQLEKKFIHVDYTSLKNEAEHNAQLIIRDRWRELRQLSPSQQAATVLSSKHFRNGNSLGVKDYLIKIFENSNDKVQFTLPSFPFKVPNALKTEHHNLDAGEILCLQRLYLITYLTQELLNKKSEFIVISDGAIYSDLCNIDPFEYKAYSQKAKTVITKMGISENVKYVDMMNDVISEKTNEYTNTLNQVKDELQYWWQKNCETSKVKYLITNMAGNIKTDDLDYSVLRSMDHENASDLFDIYSEKIQKRASQSAFEFTAKLVTLRIMNVVLKKYEGCVRSTVHPKQGQYGIHLVNSSSSIFPWQGVLLKQTTNKFNMAPSQIALQKATSEVFDIDSGDFFYYAEKNAQLGNPL